MITTLCQDELPMSSTIRSTIVVVTDRRYFLPVFVLILSLKYHNVKAYIKVLGVGLTQEERELLEQFEHVAVFAGHVLPVHLQAPPTQFTRAGSTSVHTRWAP